MSKAQELLQQADKRLKHGDVFGGSKLLAEFLKKFPNDPRAPRMRGTLGELYLSLGRLDDAREQLERAIREQGESVHLLFRLGQTYAFQGRTEQAFAVLDRVLELEPDHDGAIARRAALLQYLGQIDEAAEVIDKAYARGLSGYHLAHAFAGIASRLNRRAEAIARLKPYVSDRTIPAKVRAEMLFALGRLYDAEKDYDTAWESYTQANALLKPRLDITELDRCFDQIIETCTREAILSLERAEHSAERAILIVGMPRSGTTLLENILCAHPDIVAGGELTALPKAVSSIPGIQVPGVIPPLRRIRGNALRRANRLYLDALDAVSPDAARVIDKLPANYYYLGLLPSLLPGAHVVHCRRHPLDTCVSCFFRNFAGQNLIYTDLEWIARAYRNYVRLMRHWENVLDGILEICDAEYEQVVKDLEGSARRVVASVGLAFHPACLEFDKQRRMASTLEPEQAGRNVYDTSIGRWRNYERHLGPLIEALGPDLAGFSSEAGAPPGS